MLKDLSDRVIIGWLLVVIVKGKYSSVEVGFIFMSSLHLKCLLKFDGFKMCVTSAAPLRSSFDQSHADALCTIFRCKKTSDWHREHKTPVVYNLR